MVSLCFSSFLFSTTILHSFYARDVLYHHMMLSVTILSIALHTFQYFATSEQEVPTFFKYIRQIDKIMAHLAFCIVLCDMLILICAKSMWLCWILIFPYIILMCWFLEHSPHYEHLQKPLHTILHANSICAVHVMLWLKSYQ